MSSLAFWRLKTQEIWKILSSGLVALGMELGIELLTSRSKLMQRGLATESDFLSSKFFQLTIYSWVQCEIWSSGLTRLPTKLIQPAVGILRRLVS